MSRLRIGTCSWKYPSWAGLVYSAPDGINYLAEYARRFDTVEVDQWFWSLFGSGEPKLPRQADVEEYRSSVPDDFRFTVKAPNSITLTHFYSKAKGDPLVPNPHFLSVDLFSRFLSSLQPLGDTLGPPIFQFEYLNRQKMQGQDEFQERFQAFLAQLPSGPEYALEVRNPNYLNERYFDFVSRNGLIPVLLEGYWMPPVTQVYEKWRSWLLRQRAVVVRLHGPDREGIARETKQHWDKIVVQRDEELAGIAAMVKEFLGGRVGVYLNVNNHFEGSAPLTIERIKARLGDG